MSTKEALLDKSTQPVLDSPEALMQRLLEFENSASPVISLYLDARADQHGRDNFLPWVRKQLSERGRTFEAHTPARSASRKISCAS
jgi:hypothetical protein